MSDQEEKRGLRAWTTRDLLVTAAIALVFGLLTIGVTYVQAALMGINPVLLSVLAGIYYTPMILTMYIVRRPGAIVLTSAMIRLVTTIFNPFGWALVINILFAMFYEIPFFVTRYRDFRLRILLVSGAVAGLFAFAGVFAVGGGTSVALPVLAMALVLFIASGIGLGGWLAKVLGDSVARTGVLNSFAIGQEREAEV
jgi:energy-coupling factor transport system substrate-specific component